MAAKYSAGHLAALTELSDQLASMGNYPILNHFGVSGTRAQGMSSPIAMMIEEFVGSEICVSRNCRPSLAEDLQSKRMPGTRPSRRSLGGKA